MKRILLILTAISISFTSFSQNSYKEITVADLWKNWTFYAYSVYGLNSMNDGEHYTTLSDKGDIDKFKYADGEKVQTVVKAADFGLEIDEYEFNADETKLLLLTNKSRIYRRSFTAEYYILDLPSKKLTKLSQNGAQQIASFSPDGTKVAFIRNNNIFIKDIISEKEIQITDDGEQNKIINGIPDWVYEEEFEYNKAYEWSSDGKNLAYVKFNETNVKTFGMTMFAGAKPKLENNILYPEYRTWKYPKCGEENSIVSVHCYNLDSEKTLKIETGNETDIYIPRIRWTANVNKLAVFRLNRLQNKFEILSADINSGKSAVIFTETNKYYFDETDFNNIKFLEDGKHFVMTSERNGFRHIYLQEIGTNKAIQLTNGNFDVTAFYGYNPTTKLFYYQAAAVSPLQREIYSIDISGKKNVKLSSQNGTNEADFSKNYKYFINYFSNTQTPDFVTLNDKNGKQIRILKDNSALRKTVDEYGGINKKFFSFKTGEGVELNGWTITPPDFDQSKKYPVIVTQYSGPGSQEVLDIWSFGWDNLLAQKGAIVVCVDPRGTGARGEEFKKMTYLQLGKYETADLIETAKYLQTLPYVDKNKIGIWGWSYGGFMTSLCMTKGADYFNTGIAVAPVTNWRYYDNIYTERFMRTPQENPKGYDDNSPINFADKLKGNFFIIHGSADDNVHWQNTAEFTEALVQADKQFRQFIYTNRNHGIYGGNTRMHLYKMMLEYWEETILSK